MEAFGFIMSLFLITLKIDVFSCMWVRTWCHQKRGSKLRPVKRIQSG